MNVLPNMFRKKNWNTRLFDEGKLGVWTFMDGELTGEELKHWMFTVNRLLCQTDNDNRYKFLKWYDTAENILNGEFQKDFQERMRVTYGFEVTNSDMAFLTDKAESSKPLEIVLMRVGEILKYNISPEVVTLDPDAFSEKDMAIVNTFLKTVLNKTSYTKQFGNCITDALCYGTGVLKIENELVPSNYYKVADTLSVKHIPIDQMIIDDNIQDIQEMSYCGETKMVDPYIFYSNMTDKEKYAFEFMVENNMVLNHDKDYRRSYIGKNYDNWHFIDVLFNKDQDFRQKSAVDKRATYQVMYFKDGLDGGLIEVEVFCGVIYSIQKVKRKTFPYQSISLYPNTHNFYGISMIYLMFDDYILLLRALDAIMTSLLFATNPVYEVDMTNVQVAPGEVSSYLNIPSAVIPSNNGASIRRIERSQLTTEMYNAYELAKQSMYELAGETKFTTGQSSGSILTTGGITQMLEAGSTASQNDIPKIEFFTKNVIHILLQTISDYETEIKAKIQDDKNKNPTIRTLQLVSDTVDKLDITIKTDSQAINRQNAITAFMQLLQSVPVTEDGSTDEVRDLIITGIVDNLPIDVISKEKLKVELLTATETGRENKEGKKKQEVAQAAQALMQMYPQAGLQGINIADYLK